MTLEYNGAEIMNLIEGKAARAVAAGAQVVVAAAVPLTPILEGDLRGAIGIIDPIVDGDKVVSGVAVKDVVYARRQHEETTWNHPRGGQAKYLQTAKDATKDEVEAVIKNHLKGEFS